MRPQRRGPALVLALTLTAAFGWSLWDGVPVFRADQVGSRVRADLQRWGEASKPWTVDDWDRARADVQRAIGWTPNDASLHELLGGLHALRGIRDWGDGDPETSPGVAQYREAIVHQRRAIELRPRNAMAWAQLSLMQYAVDESAEAMWSAWRQARTLGPNEADVRFHLVEVARQAWWIAPADVKQAVEAWKPGSGAAFDAEAAAMAAAASARAPASAPD